MASTFDFSSEDHILKQYPGEIAQHLASVASKLTDMKRAEAALHEAAQAASEDLREMFWECAVVRYARPFATGVLTRPDDDRVRQFLGDDLYPAHQYILELRNKHVAHSANLMELAEPAMVLTNPSTTSEHRFLAAVSLNVRSAPPELKDVLAFLALVGRMINWFDDNLRHFTKRAHGEISAWQVESLYKLPDVEIKTMVSPAAASMTRSPIHRAARKARKK